ncbi:carboxypeptidase-like regulatory domain-containing protein [Pedobacter sp. ISL-68]|uniref:carboxypeptidase-like regulatory domain-containing protein n=1 Tax=unclassified Pedobacter TaxID=2628915 RepID=UPI001BE66344|nr:MULTISPECIES: carboxypeptidase-like regulatory domain-containing protein [unclassified Pedobacter]MBT2561218.1 carboxypeptidase-like regulatory domain-containing protein [Pedobacter sp. ISL-64]MBT2590607.1 carboxypeptidase-like regulatory domain-containing protein [Pedobacter sp. ISL-68]
MPSKLFKPVFVLIVLTVANLCSYAQQTFNLSGQVSELNGSPLPGASIYVSGSKNATVTDNNGQFLLRLNAGEYDLIIKSIGYKTLTKKVFVKDVDLIVNVKLQEKSIALADVTIKANPYRNKDLERFISLFIGTSPNAKFCKIKNPAVLDFVRNQNDNNLKVYASDFLIIENDALGYKLNYLLESFEYEEGAGKVSYKGSVYFEDLKGSDKAQQRWAQNRRSAYQGSPMHFFSALYKKNIDSEGFLILKLVNQTNSKRPSDSVLKANITRLLLKQQKKTGLINVNENDSLSYWLKLKSKPMYLPTLITKTVLVDTLLHKSENELKSITSKDIMYVVYTKRDEEPGYVSTLSPEIKKNLQFTNSQLSQIKLLVDKCAFSSNGVLVDPQSVYFSGYWGWRNVADSLPIDYIFSEK